MRRAVPESFVPPVGRLDITQAWDLYAARLTSSPPADTDPLQHYNKTATAAILSLKPSCLTEELRRVAITFLSKFGDDALAPLWSVPGFHLRGFTPKEKEFFFKRWPDQFRETPQGSGRMPPAAVKSVAPWVVLETRSRSKRHFKEVESMMHVDCRVVRHLHCNLSYRHRLPRPALGHPGFLFYEYEVKRSILWALRGLLAFLGSKRARMLYAKFVAPNGSYALAGATLQAMLWKPEYALPLVAKLPRGYVPYAGCECETRAVKWFRRS